MKELLIKYNVIKKGHFRLTSGKHSNQYINKDAIYCIPELFSLVVKKMYIDILNKAYYNSCDAVTGPAIAGAVLAAPIALRLNKIFVYPEKIKERFSENMFFRRGYDKVLKHKRVWIIEDIITTGYSVERTIMAIKDCGGSVVGISAIWNRGLYKIDDIPLLSLMNELILSYWPDECPYCREGRVPLIDPKE